MCTVTWVREAGGYELLCNRDERRGRGPELAPSVLERSGVHIVAPRDSDFGGTWIAVNELGVSLALLNGYHEGDPDPGDRPSRGSLVLSLADVDTVDALRRRVQSEELGRYRSFVLLALEPGRAAFVAEWDGTSLALADAADERMPLVSSGVDANGVRAHRTALLRAIVREEGGLGPAALERFHREHGDGPSAYSPCMHRADAETKSFTRVRVSEEEVSLRHAPGPPCRTALRSPWILPRRRREAALP